MKKLLLAVSFTMFCGFAFANSTVTSPKGHFTKKEVKKKKLGQTQWTYKCSDGVVVQFTYGCTQAQATAMGKAWCNNRSASASAN